MPADAHIPVGVHIHQVVIEPTYVLVTLMSPLPVHAVTVYAAA